MASRPRLRGDGMDSDSLAVNSELSDPRPKASSSQRHRNLQTSSKAATIAKSQKPKFVPREPVKGAVGPKCATSKSVPQKSHKETVSSISTIPCDNQNMQHYGISKPKPNATSAFSISSNTRSQNRHQGPSSQKETLASSRTGSSPAFSKQTTSIMTNRVESSPVLSNQLGLLNTINQSTSVMSKKAKVLRDSYHAVSNTADVSVQRISTEPSLTENSLKFSQATSPPRLSGSVFSKPTTSYRPPGIVYDRVQNSDIYYLEVKVFLVFY